MKRILTTSDLQTAVWMKIKQEITEEVQRLREKNDNLSNDTVQTASLRGEILFAKKILQMEQEVPTFIKPSSSV